MPTNEAQDLILNANLENLFAPMAMVVCVCVQVITCIFLCMQIEIIAEKCGWEKEFMWGCDYSKVG